jgi:nicotinamidase-related amidase
MTDLGRLDPASTAVLLMDFQNDIVGGFDGAGGAMTAAARVAAAARAAGAPVIYVVVAFRPGYPEIASSNATFSGLKSAGRMLLGTDGVAVHASVAPKAGEVTVVKHRVGAFSDTDLAAVLRGCNARTLVLTGVATSGVVLSTLRHAADQDYRCIVVRDACADRDDEVHRVLLDKVFPRQATVTTSGEIQFAAR